jgi:TonB-linked SusC/RagA family outer membrane protein
LSKIVHNPRRPARLAVALALACASLVAPALVPTPLAAQNVAPAGTGVVTGTVTGEGNQPLGDVRVSITGTRLGAMTGPDGRYTIPGLAAGSYEVRAQRIGFAPRAQQVTVSDGQTVTANFSLTVVATALSEVVSVGYTQQERRTVSDAVASVSAADVQTQATATVEEKLRGRVPGVNIVASGEPGRPAQIVVRGQNFLGSLGPLYVVDGNYMRENPNLNPDDIATIDVLKDASAAAQYGAQAANGVVVITTKRGHGGDTRIGVDAAYGYQDIPHKLDLMNATEWTNIARQAYANGGIVAPAGILATPTTNTDWQSALFQKGAIQNTTANVSGGTDVANYFLSGGYTRQTGTVLRTGFDRYSLRANTQGVKGRLRLGENMAVSRSENKNLNGFPLIDAVRMIPGIPVYNAANASGYGYGSDSLPTFGTNPVGAQLIQDNINNSNQLNGNVFAEASILRYLTYRFNFGVGFEDYNGTNFRRQEQLRLNSAPDSAELGETRDNTLQLLTENQLTFNNQYGRNGINATAAYTEQRNNYDRITAGRRGYINPYSFETIDAGTQHVQNGGFRDEANLRSLLARANYTFADRYILTGSVRRDGSSRFGPGNRWGTFSAFSGGWVISDEGFYNSVPGTRFLNYMKLRASTGRLGNQDFGNYQYAPVINVNINYPFAGLVNPGATGLSLANPNIKWQENQESNVGLDFALLNSALSIQMDYYQSKSKGLLVQAPLPPSSGSDVAPFVNAGAVKNAGFELGATHKYDRGDFGLNTTLSLNTTRNRVVTLGNGAQPIFAGSFGVARTAVGSSIGEFYVRKTDGIFQSAAEVAASCAQKNTAQPGDIRYVDLNGDCRIDDADRYNAGNAIPKLDGGLFWDAHWHAFDAKLGLHGSFGAKIFNATRFWAERTDENNNHFAGFTPWTPTNHSTTTPRAVFGGAGAANAFAQSDRWLESGNYVRIQNLEFGFRLPSNIGGRYGLNTGNSRLYVAVQNLHTFTNYTGYDPEVIGQGDILARGIDDGRIYPNARTFTIGVNIAQ